MLLCEGFSAIFRIVKCKDCPSESEGVFRSVHTRSSVSRYITAAATVLVVHLHPEDISTAVLLSKVQSVMLKQAPLPPDKDWNVTMRNSNRIAYTFHIRHF